MDTGDGAVKEENRFVALCREAIRRAVPGLFDELFSKLDDALYDLADKSESNRLYTTYFDAMRVFRRQRHEILSLFLHNLLDNDAAAPTIRSDVVRGSASSTGDSEGLALMGDAELEESLAITNLISKAENRYRSDLSALRRHLAALRGQAVVDSRADPLGPHAVCKAFRVALSPVDDVDLAIKLVVYKLFDKQVMDRFGDVYARCRELAEGQNRSADDPPGRTTPPVTDEREFESTSQPWTETHARETGNASPRGQVRTRGGHTMAFSDLQRLLGRHKPASAGSGGYAVVDTRELMSALSRLQELTGPEAAAGELRLRLSDELHLGVENVPSRALGRTDEDTLDLVFLLFEHILQGSDIPDALKVLIGRLQIPIATLALLDKSFFEDTHHPARCLLNHLAQLAVGWTDEEDRSPHSIYGRVEWVVDQVIASYDGESAVLVELDAELCALLAREREQARSWEARLQQELELKERQHSARQLVKEAISERLRDRAPVPEAVSSLLYEGWQQVLLTAYLRDGTSGSDWRNAIRIIDRLVWSVQPKVEYEDRRELLRSIPELLRTLRESLAEVSYDQRRLALWFKELQALHIAALRGAGSGFSYKGAGTQTAGARAVLPRANTGGTVVTGDTKGAVLEVPGLEEGAWIEIRRDDGGLIRVKLAWRSPKSDICLFVDRRGRKALKLAGEDILTLLRRGTLTVLGGLPIVDRAMDEVVQTLRGDGGT